MKKEMVIGTCDLHFPPHPRKMGKKGYLNGVGRRKKGWGPGDSEQLGDSITHNQRKKVNSTWYGTMARYERLADSHQCGTFSFRN